MDPPALKRAKVVLRPSFGCQVTSSHLRLILVRYYRGVVVVVAESARSHSRDKRGMSHERYPARRYAHLRCIHSRDKPS